MMLSLTAMAQNIGEIDNLLATAEKHIVDNSSLSRKLLEQVESSLGDQPYPAYRAHLLNLKGHLDILQGDYNSAFEKVSQAKQFAIQAGDKVQQAEAVRRQGIITSLLDLHGEALELLRESLLMHQSIGSKYVVKNLLSIGNVYNNSEEWLDDLIETGESMVAESIKLGDSINEQLGYGFILSGYLKSGKFDQAKVLLDRLLEEFENPHDVLKYYQAETLFRTGQRKEALAKLDELFRSAFMYDYKFQQVAFSALKSEILLALGETDQAKESLGFGLKIAQTLNFGRFQLQALQGLIDLAVAEKDFQAAYQYQKQYAEVQKNAFDTRQSEQLAFNRARLETEEKTQQIAELRFSQEIALQQNRFQLYVIATAVTIATLMLILFVRTTQQKRKLTELADSLRLATEAKSDFLARMSHEIRTPLNAIIGLTKLTQRSQLDAEQQINLKQIEQSSQTLLSVINDILDFSKIEAGKLTISLSPFELDKLIEQTIDMHALKAREKGIELIQYVARDVPLHLSGDEVRIQQVLNNLLSNALKFTDSGLVSISVNKKYSEQGVMLEFSVKDSGIGLTEQQIETLFEAFTQADESTTREYGGTGLGLSISQNLVSLMGGEIWVESKPKQGATFYFTVLVEACQQPQGDQVSRAMNVSQLRVLVVDDVLLSRQAIGEALVRIGMSPDLAKDSKQALEQIRSAALKNVPYDALILDWKMDNVDGIELAAIIKQEFAAQLPRIIMLSAFDIDALKVLGQPLGIQDYLQKPVNSSSLLNCLLNVAQQTQPAMIFDKADEQEVPDFSHAHVLLVEDDELNQKVAKFFLADTKIKVSTAENGAIALELLAKSNSYDLVLMDMQMPVMDGLTATQKIRQELKLDIPIIAMTAHALPSEIEKSFDAGANGHLIKPIQAKQLYETLSIHLAK